MRTNIPEKIPLLGKIFRGSNRAYTMFLNRQRADAFDAFVNMAGGPDVVTDAELKLFGNAVNVFTGRGSIPLEDNHAANVMSNSLAKYLFSPRFLTSRFETLMLSPVRKGIVSNIAGGRGANIKARAIVAQQYLRFATGIAAMYGLASLAGASIELDPRSSEFGKMRFGNTVIDPLAGLSQAAVLFSRLQSGQTKNGDGQIESIRAEESIGDKDKAVVPYNNTISIVDKFIRQKLAPVPATIVDRYSGYTMDKKPFRWKDAALRAVTPLGVGSSIESFNNNPPMKASGLTLLNAFGMGTQEYD